MNNVLKDKVLFLLFYMAIIERKVQLFNSLDIASGIYRLLDIAVWLVLIVLGCYWLNYIIKNNKE